MRRRTFDLILTGVGAVLTLTLLAAAILLTWGHTFAHNQIRDELAAQQVFFPPAGSPALADPQIGPYLNQYAGQQLLTGAQAKAYADHFIAVHLKEVAGGQTYAQVSTAAQADPSNATLKAQAQTLFQGETLRGLLLNAYAFDQIATIALYAAIAAYIGAGLMLILTILGIVQLARRRGDEEIFGAQGRRPASAE